MSKEIVRVEIERRIIVGHSTTQIVNVVTCQGSIDVVACILRLQMYRLAQIRIGITTLASRQRYHGTCVPCVSIVGVNFQTALW